MSNKLLEAQLKAQAAAEAAIKLQEELQAQLAAAKQAAEQAQRELEEAQESIRIREEEIRKQITEGIADISTKFSNFKEIIWSIPPQLTLNFIANLSDFSDQDVYLFMNTSKQGKLNIEITPYTETLIDELNDKLSDLNFSYIKNQSGEYILTKNERTTTRVQNSSQQEIQFESAEDVSQREENPKDTHIEKVETLENNEIIELNFTLNGISYQKEIEFNELSLLLFNKTYEGIARDLCIVLLKNMGTPLKAKQISTQAGHETYQRGYIHRYKNQFLKDINLQNGTFVEERSQDILRYYIEISENLLNILIKDTNSREVEVEAETIQEGNKLETEETIEKLENESINLKFSLKGISFEKEVSFTQLLNDLFNQKFSENRNEIILTLLQTLNESLTIKEIAEKSSKKEHLVCTTLGLIQRGLIEENGHLEKKSNQIKLSDTYLESLLSEEEKELLNSEDKLDVDVNEVDVDVDVNEVDIDVDVNEVEIVDVNEVEIEKDDNYDSLLNEGLDLLSGLREETVSNLEPSSNEEESLNQQPKERNPIDEILTSTQIESVNETQEIEIQKRSETNAIDAILGRPQEEVEGSPTAERSLAEFEERLIKALKGKTRR